MSRSSSVIRYGLLLLLTMQNTATVLCLRASMINASTSRNKYVVSTLVLTMEVIKLLLILTILMTVQLKFSIRKTVQLLYNEIVCRPLDTIPLALPSLLYVVQDNLIIYSLSCLDAATYQVTYQARILTTALFARGLLKQELPVKKWLSLFLLMLGVILTQLNFNEESGDFSFRSQREGSVYVFGLIAISCATLTSGFAGVYNEKLIKNGKQSSLLIRSLQLSLFSVFFAFLGVLVKDGGTVTKQGYFHGYSPFVWLIATMQASGGIIVAGTINRDNRDSSIRVKSQTVAVAEEVEIIAHAVADLPPYWLLTCVIYRRVREQRVESDILALETADAFLLQQGYKAFIISGES
ncbi:hypothetical protein OUZ56_030475 [Daphnia magna]|uniref:UDP-N-acetylglucosamine transporter n=1 Tax=Daphnia magna TaxID=35525 RepID=A0ABQ9ZRE3_9CRUS|nr:hypothetical protein OUZ56_030475 [Daphnia magna]